MFLLYSFPTLLHARVPIVACGETKLADENPCNRGLLLIVKFDRFPPLKPLRFMFPPNLGCSLIFFDSAVAVSSVGLRDLRLASPACSAAAAAPAGFRFPLRVGSTAEAVEAAGFGSEPAA